MKKKLMAVALATIIAVMAIAGASLAWLTDTTDVVTNTFTYGDIEIELNETTSGYKIVPGKEEAKDPTVTVTSGSEQCYVYVLIDNQLVIGTETVATIDINTTDWICIETDGTKSLYRYKAVVDASSATITIPVFNNVKYDGELITTENIEALATKTIVLRAYAHQSEHIVDINVADTAAKTWADTALTTP